MLIFSQWEQARRGAEFNKSSQLWYLTPSLGITSVSYRQTEIPDFSQLAITTRVAIDYNLGGNLGGGIAASRWSAGANAYFTLLPIRPSRSDVSVRFLGINARIGYRFPWPAEPWRFSLMAGLFYGQMFVSNGAFGYKPILYPQAYPVLARPISSRDTLSVYFKYVPMGKLSEFEFATGLAWLRNFTSVPGGSGLSVNLDYSNLDFQASPTVQIGSRSISLSLGYRI